MKTDIFSLMNRLISIKTISKIRSYLYFLNLLFIAISSSLSPSFCYSKDLNIGLLLPLSGALSAQGNAQGAALELAKEDINQFFESIGVEKRIKLYIEDTATQAKKSLEALKKLHKEHECFLVIGPNSSSVAKACLDYINDNDIIMLSPASTAPSLAIRGDNLFRICPNDLYQAQAMAHMLRKDNIKVLVGLTRNDLWGSDLHENIAKEFNKDGGLVLKNVTYDPKTKDFSTIIKELSQHVREGIKKVGSQSVAIHVASYSEIVAILKASENNAILKAVRWYGADATAKHALLIKDARAAELAQLVSLQCPKFEVHEDQMHLFMQFASRLEEKGYKDINAYTGTTYDALWIAAMASLGKRKKSISAMKKAIFSVSSQNLGITGWNILNRKGDRSVGDYSFWEISKKSDGNYYWSVSRVYHKHVPDAK